MSANADGAKLLEWVDPNRTALVLIDMQVDFAAPDGALGKAGVDLSTVPPALEAAQRLLESARACGAPVIFVGLGTSKATDSFVWGEWRRRKGEPSSEEGLCRIGARGSEFFGPTPDSDELTIWKLRYSGFFGTSLDAVLRAKGIDTLVMCGLTTECCVDCTARDAFHLDYFVYIAKDACAAYDEHTHTSALANLALNCATLVATDDVLSAWSVTKKAAKHA